VWGFRRAVLGAATIWTLGCGEDPGPPVMRMGWSERDSAGIQIITVGSPDAGPALSLGEAVDLPPPPAGFARIGSGAASPNSVFITDVSNRLIHRYSSEGTFQASFGRGGEGPGEFGYPAALFWVDGELVVQDRGRGRLIRLTESGEFLSEIPTDGIYESIILPDGRTRVGIRVERYGQPQRGPDGELHRSQATSVVLPDSGGEIVVHQGVTRGEVTENRRSWPTGFPVRPMLSEHPSGAAVALGGEAEVIVTNKDGPLTILRWQGGRRELTDAVWRAAREELIELGQPRESALAMFSDAFKPDLLPWASVLRASQDGVLWAQAVETWRTDRAQVVVRIDPVQQSLSHVQLPRAGSLLAAMNDRLLIRHLDSLGVHSVWLYPVEYSSNPL